MHATAHPATTRPLADVDPLRRDAANFLKLRDAANALPPGQLVGRLVSFVVADGAAVYRIACEAPLRLEHVPVHGSYRLPPSALQRLTRADLEANLTYQPMPARCAAGQA